MRLILTMTLSCFVAGISVVNADEPCSAEQATQLHIGTQSLNITVAATQKDRSRGLSGRDALEAGRGMLFVFSSPDRVAFWMRDMNFPIDLIWISAARQVIGALTLQPCDEEVCPVYRSPSLVAYVLEINAGEFAGKVGDHVSYRCDP